MAMTTTRVACCTVVVGARVGRGGGPFRVERGLGNAFLSGIVDERVVVVALAGGGGGRDFCMEVGGYPSGSGTDSTMAEVPVGAATGNGHADTESSNGGGGSDGDCCVPALSWIVAISGSISSSDHSPSEP